MIWGILEIGFSLSCTSCYNLASCKYYLKLQCPNSNGCMQFNFINLGVEVQNCLLGNSWNLYRYGVEVVSGKVVIQYAYENYIEEFMVLCKGCCLNPLFKSLNSI